MASANYARILTRLTRFNLRTFLITAVLIGAGSGFVTARVLYVVEILECVPEVEKHGVQVLSDFHDRYGFHAVDQRGRRFGIVEWCLSDPEYITLLSCNTAATDSLLKKLTPLHTVRGMNAGNLSIEGLRQVALLPNLQSLYLQNSVVDDESMLLLTQLPKLERLHLVNVPITDGGLCHFARMKSLQELQLHDTEVTPVGLLSLRTIRPELKIDFAFSRSRELGRRK